MLAFDIHVDDTGKMFFIDLEIEELRRGKEGEWRRCEERGREVRLERVRGGSTAAGGRGEAWREVGMGRRRVRGGRGRPAGGDRKPSYN
ncbi:unnamed protein product [Linum trigynum]|uniref:Uncharacterized protein n=1 Tax=Linum trigynum TaxID=586398 RepID=A0AAV2G0T7_9ROSI